MAVHEVMTAMGWLRTGSAYGGPPRLAAGSGTGKLVGILGAGIGGLTAAYELLKAGYAVVILEPQLRNGGRSLTARHGTKIVEESAEHGRTEQTCKFDEGLYLNMGPGRLPYHHRRVLHYCRELRVQLEIYVMTTTANLWQRQTAFGGDPMLRRRLATDAMGYISELLAKQVCTGAQLSIPLDADERKLLLDLLVTFGDLNGGGTACGIQRDQQVCTNRDAFHYCGSTRAGCVDLNVHNTCRASDPIPLKTLLRSKFWNNAFYQPLSFEWQPTLFQPVGGMDRIVDAFSDRLDSFITNGLRVEEIRVEESGVKVAGTDILGRPASWTFDYCLSNMPLPILAKLRTNFTPEYDWAVKHARFQPTCKVGWQANRRFWEDVEIYGGISYIDAPITQMWYPSDDYFTTKGTLTGAYNYGTVAETFGKLLPERRLVDAREQGSRLHPQIADPSLVTHGISIAWQNVPFQHGGWAQWSANSPDDAKAYARLLAPDQKRFFVVGDQVSTLPGWQEGAMMSAEHVVEQIGGLRPLTVPEIQRAPDTRMIVLGTN
jgi:monoamine oxidase